MSAAATPARRLLAMLEEERSLETRPLDEVLADLQAHGVDAAGPIRLARRLAESNAGPAAALLGAVIEDEAVEAEIAALEAAPIGEVRDQLDVGTVAAVAASAKRRGGAQSNVVGLRRRRSTTWAWAGSLVGMAACVLIVVAAWWPPSELMSTSPDIASVEVRPARPEAPTTAPPAAMEAAQPEPDYSMAPPQSQSLGRLAANTETAESEVDGVADDFEAAPASPASEERSQVPEVASRIAAPTGTPAASGGAGAPGMGVVVDHSPPAPVAVDRAPVRADPAQPEALREVAEPPVPPLPPVEPEDRRTFDSDATAGPTTENAAAGQTEPPAQLGALARPADPSGDVARGLSGVPAPDPLLLKDAGARLIVVDGVVFPRPLGIGDGENWSDGAFPMVFHDVESSNRPRPIGLVPDPPTSMVFGSEGRVRGEDESVLIFPDGAGYSMRPGTVQAEPSSLLAALSQGLIAMVGDGQGRGAGPWTGQVVDRLEEARALANGGTVLALLTIRNTDAEADVALVAADGVEPTGAELPLEPLLRRWFGDDAARFRLIVLPPR